MAAWESLGNSIGQLFFFCLGIAVVMSPWWIRNYWAVGSSLPTTLQVGASLYDSFHEGASGGSDEGMTFSGDFARELAKDRQNRQTGQGAVSKETEISFEYELDQRLKNAAIDWAKANPSAVARLCLLKFWRTWNPFPQATQLGSFSVGWWKHLVTSQLLV